MNSTILLPIALALAAGAAMAAGNAPSETLPNGVVVQHTKVGGGASPAATDVVEVNYRGTLDNGQEFDSSARAGKPVKFPLNGVIPCWTEGLQKMKAGGKATLTCPAQTAYGQRGVPGVIPPNATLHFEVELLTVAKK